MHLHCYRATFALMLMYVRTTTITLISIALPKIVNNRQLHTPPHLQLQSQTRRWHHEEQKRFANAWIDESVQQT